MSAGAGTSTVRHIHTRFGRRQAADLLQNVFAAELVSPSRCIWIVSPWISDIPVLDNRAAGFSSLAGEWERSRIRLSTVLGWLLKAGTTVHIATRSGESASDDFVARMQGLGGTGSPRLKIHLRDTLHEKGILTDGFYLGGSMNITYNGIQINDEFLSLFTDPADVALHRATYESWWGGAVG